MILEATLRVVGRDGAAAVTHRRVAAEAALPLAATTYWFDSKDELLAEAFALAAGRDAKRVRTLAAELREREEVDVAASVTALLSAELAGARTTLIAFYALSLEAARNPVLRATEAEWSAAYHEAVGDILERGGSRSPAIDARVLVAAIDGLVLEQLAAGEEADVAQAVRPVVDRLVGALLGPRAAGS